MLTYMSRRNYFRSHGKYSMLSTMQIDSVDLTKCFGRSNTHLEGTFKFQEALREIILSGRTIVFLVILTRLL